MNVEIWGFSGIKSSEVRKHSVGLNYKSNSEFFLRLSAEALQFLSLVVSLPAGHIMHCTGADCRNAPTSRLR